MRASCMRTERINNAMIHARATRRGLSVIPRAIVAHPVPLRHAVKVWQGKPRASPALRGESLHAVKACPVARRPYGLACHATMMDAGQVDPMTGRPTIPCPCTLCRSAHASRVCRAPMCAQSARMLSADHMPTDDRRDRSASMRPYPVGACLPVWPDPMRAQPTRTGCAVHVCPPRRRPAHACPDAD